MQLYSHEYSLETIDSVVEAIFKHAQGLKTFTLTGDLGMGKSTLIRAFARYLAYNGDMPSPSFPILLTYPSFYHYDFYRMDEDYLQEYPEAIHTIREALEAPVYHFIEWGEQREALLIKPRLELTLSAGSSEKNRKVSLNLRA